QHKKHLEFVRRFSFHTSSTFLDYLHGDVPEDEAANACFWEYARESLALRDAAKRRDELRVELTGKGLTAGNAIEKAALCALEDVGLENHTVFPMHSWEFLVCESFPTKDWNALSRQERNRIMQVLPGDKIRPLRMADSWTLKASGVLDRFLK